MTIKQMTTLDENTLKYNNWIPIIVQLFLTIVGGVVFVLTLRSDIRSVGEKIENHIEAQDKYQASQEKINSKLEVKINQCGQDYTILSNQVAAIDATVKLIPKFENK